MLLFKLSTYAKYVLWILDLLSDSKHAFTTTEHALVWDSKMINCFDNILSQYLAYIIYLYRWRFYYIFFLVLINAVCFIVATFFYLLFKKCHNALLVRVYCCDFAHLDIKKCAQLVLSNVSPKKYIGFVAVHLQPFRVISIYKVWELKDK